MEDELFGPLEGLDTADPMPDGTFGYGAARSGHSMGAALKARAGATHMRGLDHAAVSKLWAALSGKLKTIRGLALVLQLKFGHMFSFLIRHGQRTAAPKLQHSFVVAVPSLDGFPDVSRIHPSNTIVIDPFFKEQFVIGRADPEYEAFLSDVPEVFVGPLALLHSTLEVIYYMMHNALARLHVGTPPWRQPEAVMGMWFPQAYRDEHIQPQVAGMLVGQRGRQQLDAEAGSSGAGPMLLPKALSSDASSSQAQVTKYQAAPKVVVLGFDVEKKQDNKGVAIKPVALAGAAVSDVTRQQDKLPAAGGMATMPACDCPRSADGMHWRFHGSSGRLSSQSASKFLRVA